MLTRLVMGCLGAAAAATPALADCTLYEHQDHGGVMWEMSGNEWLIMRDGEDVGSTTGSNVYHESSWNDEVSSFAVGRGCTLTLWEDFDQGGASFESDGSYLYVGDDWNDEASEAFCTCR